MSREIIDQITALHRKRNFAMEQRKRSRLALGAFLRLALGWRKDLPDAERKRISDQAADYVDNGYGPFVDVIAASELARAPYEKIERDCLKEMDLLARQLPVWKTFGKPIRGFGAGSLAVIIAEAGDLSNYATDAKLWKRMGVAVLDGVRQGGLTKGAGADAWIEHGYSPIRRSRMWNVGASLIKGNRDGKYRQAYDRRRAHTMVTHPDWWVDKDGEPKLNKDGKPSSAHGAADAQRYMEKRLLRDLWKAWRRTIGDVAVKPSFTMSAAAPTWSTPVLQEIAS